MSYCYVWLYVEKDEALLLKLSTDVDSRSSSTNNMINSGKNNMIRHKRIEENMSVMKFNIIL